MSAATSATDATARVLAMLLRRRLRGSTRLTLAVAHRLSGLKELPIAFAGRTCYVDLRVASSHPLLAGSFPEPAERELVAKIVRPGHVAVDVGGHWGIYTLLLADLTGPAGRVFTFEPSPVVLPALSRSIGEIQNATLFPMGLGEAADRRQLRVPADASMAHLVPLDRSTGESDRAFEVPVESLDAVVARGLVAQPDFVKCDVEGAEALVFRGAQAVLDRPLAPAILFESNPAAAARLGLNGDDASDFLSRLPRPGYHFFAIGADAQPEPLERVPETFMNVLALPAARLGLAL